MNLIIALIQIALSGALVAIAIYSALYFTQITRIEKQFGLKMPEAIKKVLAGLTMVPMIVSLAVLILVVFTLFEN